MDLVEFFRTTVLTGSMLAAIPVALIAGLISFASPCVLPLLPGYVGYVSGMTGAAADRSGVRAKAPTRKVAGGLALFVAGFTTVFVGLGIAFASIGYALAPYVSIITRVLGVLVILMGLAFAGWLPFAQSEKRLRIDMASGQVGAFVLGVVFGLGWTPCIGPTLSAVLTLALDGAHLWRGAILALAYCLGLGIPFIVLGALFARSTKVLSAMRRHRVTLMRLGGVLLIVLGLLLVSGLWDSVTAWLQGIIGGFETVV